MNKILSFLTVVGLGISFTTIAAQGEVLGPPPDTLVPTMTATQPNPFVNSNDITLSSKAYGTVTIYYDLNNPRAFDVDNAIKYTDVPILIVASTTLRAVSVTKKGGEQSGIATWTFTKNLAPTISLASPISGQVLTQGIATPLTVKDAVDVDGSVAEVRYFRKAGGASVWEDIGASTTGPTFPVNWIPAAPGSGPYALRAIAKDNLGETGLSQDVPVSINAAVTNLPPTVTLTSPLSGSTYNSPATITLAALASDPDPVGGGITKVEFYQGSTLLATLATSPYTYSWTGVPTGDYSLSAMAYDNLGAVTTSVPVTISVSANKPPIVSAGADAILVIPPGASVSTTLKGVASDPENTSMTYSWTVPTGVSISGETTLAPTVTFTGTGSYDISFKATDAGLPAASSSDNVIITVNNKPVITSQINATATALQSFSYTLTATGSPTPTMSTNGVLPAGLTWNAATSVLSGTPPAVGVFTVNLNATNSAGQDDKVLTITVGAAPVKPTITSPLSASGIASQAFSYTLTAIGSPTPTLKLTGVVPSWLNWDAPTGVLTGTPTGPGVFTVNLNATNSAGQDDKVLTITIGVVQIKPIITSAVSASGTAFQHFSYTLTATGSPTPTLKPTGVVPSWLTWVPASNSLLGTPQGPGVFTVNLNATNSAGQDDKVLTITIGTTPIKPTITSPLSVNAKASSTFTYTATASGSPSITYSANGLPPGLTFSGADISGSPTLTGTYTSTLTATNAYGTDTKSLVITISSDPKITTNLPESLTLFNKSKATFSIGATGYPAVSYQWQYAGESGVFGNIGNNSSSYTIDSVSPSSAGKYRVLVKNDVGPTEVSISCNLVVKPLPLSIAIVTQPVPQTILEGQSTTFRVRATGAPTLLYQWFKETTALSPTPTSKDSDFIATAPGVYHAVVTNPNTDVNKPSTYAVSDTARLTVQLPKLPKPTANPTTQSFSTPTFNVVLSNAVESTDIRYTLDGSSPNQNDAKPNFQFKPGDILTLTGTTTVNATAYKNGYRTSDMMTEVYTYLQPGKVVKPTIRPIEPNFKASILCTLSTTDGSDIYYTTNGSPPTPKPEIRYTGPFSITSTTTVIAIGAKQNLTNSDTLMKTYTLDKVLSKAQPPVATPPGASFSTGQTVTLTSGTDGAAIYYTLDGTSPDTSSTRKLYSPITGLTVPKTLTLRAVSILSNNFLNSDIKSWDYKLVPTLSASLASGTEFNNQVTVKLTATPPNAEIRYTIGDIKPTITSEKYPAEGLTITSTTTISALAVLDGVVTPISIFSYSLKGGQLAPPSPVTQGSTATFADSLKVSLFATEGSEIHYTVNGDLPTTLSPIYQSPFWIDSTITIEAIAIKKDYEHSKVMFATFTLIPSMPIISPVGGTYASAQKVTMSCSSKRASLFYTLDGEDPTPINRTEYHLKDTIFIKTDKTLKAIAVAGNMASDVRTETYGIFGVSDTTLQPGDFYYLKGGYTISSPEDQSAIVHVRLSSADSLNLIGFDGVQYSISVSLAEKQPFDPPPTFPKLSFTRSLSEKRSLYKLDPSGKIYFISGADTVTIGQPGIYFMGIDVSPPKITYLGEKILANDSTSVSFSIEDNVANVVLDIKRSDAPSKNIRQLSMVSPARFELSMKNPIGVLQSLDVQVIASDYQLSSYLPSDSKYMLSLSQSLGAFIGPSKWGVGLNSKHPYDLISIPLDLNPPLSLSALSKTIPNMSIQSVVWNSAKNKYLPVDLKETFQPGMAFWVSSFTRLSGLALPAAKTSAHGIAKYSVKIKQGWNQIGNPHLEKLFWPVSRADQAAYRSSPLKGLWAYNAEIGEYVESDSLEPWRGYFVYSYLTQDTAITLSYQPASNGSLLKKFGEASSEVSLSMGWGKWRTLKLGAIGNASNGLGREDEFELPHENSMNYLKAIREGHSLSTDWIRFEQGGLLTWTVVLGGTGDSLPPLKILEQNLPEGYETWAVSKSRSMKFKLEAGQSISASGLPQDTLTIYSGPKEQIQKLNSLQKLATHAPQLNLAVISKPSGFQLEISLPSKAIIKATLWGLDGKRVGTFSIGPIAEGLYHFDYVTNFKGTVNGLKPGIYILSLDIQGQGLHSKITRKIFPPR